MQLNSAAVEGVKRLEWVETTTDLIKWLEVYSNDYTTNYIHTEALLSNAAQHAVTYLQKAPEATLYTTHYTLHKCCSAASAVMCCACGLVPVAAMHDVSTAALLYDVLVTDFTAQGTPLDPVTAAACGAIAALSSQIYRDITLATTGFGGAEKRAEVQNRSLEECVRTRQSCVCAALECWNLSNFTVIDLRSKRTFAALRFMLTCNSSARLCRSSCH
eukprot:3122-Heterococcus_DN1.PRE.3